MSYASQYQRAVDEARAAFLNAGGASPKFIATMYEEFADMLIRIVEEGSENVISTERAEELSASIIRLMRRLEARLSAAFDEAQAAAFEASVFGHSAAIADVSVAAGIRLTTSFAAVPEMTLRLMMIRRGLGQAVTFRTLTNWHITRAAAEVDRMLFSAVARGQSVARTTKEIAAAIAQDNPRLLEILSKTGPRGGRTRAAIEEGFKISDEDAKELKRLLYDSRRIAHTELGASLQESDTMASIRSPVIGALRWMLSPLHTVPDECDVLASQNYYGLGAGVYPPEAFPSPPHPFDQCRSSKIIRNPALWGEPRPLFEAPDFLGAERKGSVEGILGARAKAMKQKPPTDRKVDRSRDHARQAVQRAYRVYQDHGLRDAMRI